MSYRHMDISITFKRLINSKNGRSLIILVFLVGFISGLLIYLIWNNIKKKIKYVQKIKKRISIKTECKMVLCIRSDLKMGKGKMCSQCCHACLAVYRKVLKRDQMYGTNGLSGKRDLNYLSMWKSSGQKKVVLKVSSLDELHEIEKKAAKENLLTATIIDAGRTQIEPDTATVIAIEPAPEDIVNKVTGKLSLL